MLPASFHGRWRPFEGWEAIDHSVGCSNNEMFVKDLFDQKLVTGWKWLSWTSFWKTKWSTLPAEKPIQLVLTC
ncbi:MAG: hypothetical protein ACTS7D_01275 [Candidatus Hodgkinia cicadicola]